MGYRIVKQPDGKLAVFSSYCDQWAACDASADDVRDWFAASAVESSNISIDRITAAVLDDRPEDVYYRDVSTIEELDARSLRHGGKTLADLIASAPLIDPRTHEAEEPDWTVAEELCEAATEFLAACVYPTEWGKGISRETVEKAEGAWVDLTAAINAFNALPVCRAAIVRMYGESGAAAFLRQQAEREAREREAGTSPPERT